MGHLKRAYYSPQEIGEHLGISPRTVRRWTHEFIYLGKLRKGEDVLVMGSPKKPVLRIKLEAFKEAARVRRLGRPVDTGPLRG